MVGEMSFVSELRAYVHARARADMGSFVRLSLCAFVRVRVLWHFELTAAIPLPMLLALPFPSCPACDVDEACENADDCSSDVCAGGICTTSYPTPVPSPVPSSSPTWTPCPWLEVPADPQLESAKFSSTGGKLFLQFDSETDRAGFGGMSFSCDQLVDFPQVSYATCTWTSNSLLTVRFPRITVVEFGALLRCCTLLYHRQLLTIGPRVSPITTSLLLVA